MIEARSSGCVDVDYVVCFKDHYGPVMCQAVNEPCI